MIKKALGLAAICAMGLTMTSIAPASAEPPHKGKSVSKGGSHSSHGGHSNRGRNIGAGIAAGVVGAIILNEAARASSSRSALSTRKNRYTHLSPTTPTTRRRAPHLLPASREP